MPECYTCKEDHPDDPELYTYSDEAHGAYTEFAGGEKEWNCADCIAEWGGDDEDYDPNDEANFDYFDGPLEDWDDWDDEEDW